MRHAQAHPIATLQHVGNAPAFWGDWLQAFNLTTSFSIRKMLLENAFGLDLMQVPARHPTVHHDAAGHQARLQYMVAAAEGHRDARRWDGDTMKQFLSVTAFNAVCDGFIGPVLSQPKLLETGQKFGDCSKQMIRATFQRLFFDNRPPDRSNMPDPDAQPDQAMLVRRFLERFEISAPT